MPVTLANLPNVSKAKLPANYKRAAAALATCQRMDECQQWARKAEALASYAKQAGDTSLRKMADRIQARAIARCGELLREIRPGKGGLPAHSTSRDVPTSRAKAARDAGMSNDQKHTALRVANVPVDVREWLIESDEPPTVTELAAMGTRKPLVDLKGRDPADYALATHALGHLRRFAEFTDTADPLAVIRGTGAHERARLTAHTAAIIAWCQRIRREVTR